MLTRLYIDNFRCFVNFEYRPARRQLIIGGNGSGKSSLIDALSFLHRFAVRGESLDDLPLLDERTRWLSQINLSFELEGFARWPRLRLSCGDRTRSHSSDFRVRSL